GVGRCLQTSSLLTSTGARHKIRSLPILEFRSKSVTLRARCAKKFAQTYPRGAAAELGSAPDPCGAYRAQRRKTGGLMRRVLTAAAVLLVSVAVGTALQARGKDSDKDKDKENVAAGQDATVQFAQPQPNPAGPTTHFLLPDDVTIAKGRTVTFVVNGAAHGIAIHRVSKNTTREDIAEDLCQGPAGTAESDRAARATVCNNAAVTTVVINGTPTTITGSQNLDYMITDGDGNLIIEPGFNIANSNPRLDDAVNGIRLLATSGDSPGDDKN